MTVTAHRKALVFCVDRAEHPFALFAAHGAARSSPDRDFDILICSLDPLDIPDQPPSLNQAPSADVDPELQSATHNIAIQIHKLDVLPHANMDTKPNMGVAVEAM